MSGTEIDAALVALTATFAAVAPAGWQVVDGSPAEAEPLYLYVGHSSVDGSMAVEATFSANDASLATDWDSYNIACELSGWTGDTEFTPDRAAVFAAYRTFVGALAADRSLGGIGQRCRASQLALEQVLTGEGAVVTLRFTVSLDVFTIA